MSTEPAKPLPTVIDRLIVLFPQAKRNTLRGWVEDKRVKLNGATVKSLKQIVNAGDKVEVVDASEVPMKPQKLDEGLKVVYEDKDVIIALKPNGLLTATDAKELRPTVLKILTEYVKRNNNKAQLHLVHRLDRDASGLLVFARNLDALNALKKQFFHHTVTRQYDVIVHGIPKKEKATLENLLLEDEVAEMVKVTTDMKRGQIAKLDYQTIAVNKPRKLAHLRCTLYTGRKHQIRVQLKAIGHPVCADDLYGPPEYPGPPVDPPGRLALHASHLEFEHPRTKKRIGFHSAMPQTFVNLL